MLCEANMHERQVPEVLCECESLCQFHEFLAGFAVYHSGMPFHYNDLTFGICRLTFSVHLRISEFFAAIRRTVIDLAH